MRQMAMTGVVAGALVLATAAPATAAAPTRDASRNTFLSLSSPGCMTGEQPCLSVFAAEGEDGNLVCVELPQARGSLSGCTDTSPETLTVTRTSQSIQPTRVTVVRLDCEFEDGHETCEVAAARTVTVSATAVTIGRRVNRTSRAQERTPECTFISSFRSRSAAVAGTLTIDGRRHRLTGEAGTTRNRFLSRGCDEFV